MKNKDSRFPESPQSHLWAMLTARQQAEAAAVLRHMKKASQRKLCHALTDYIAHAAVPGFGHDDFMLSAAFVYLTGLGMAVKEPWLIAPDSDNNL